ncbi:transglycosylase SLT domain-containing protein [Stappia sp. F7233]|uniref:Transglycosylase SLT domain-containing protein n=1 Tax=Stappia albiluteola TaxID=2758565 RepID=A0A839ADI1_9HYPH|nr:transglycosylase SLT domain-containing protein [Stappia albiluteola]MBA5777591.1 transglycosylase SLT domain-containing protein [Stappia albiluteola]
MKISGSASIASRIEHAFQAASSTTGASFDYLLKTAQRESALNPQARAKTSSASGLFQFIESTWLETVKESGHRHGLGGYAEKIERTPSGHYRVSDAALRKEILALRKDPEISARLAGELTQKNANYLRDKLGREPSDGELYIAHFLGAGGANKLIGLAESKPDVAASDVFAKQANANRRIFFNSDGSAKTVGEVYANLIRQHAPSAGETLVAGTAGQNVPVPTAAPRTVLAFAPQSQDAGGAPPQGGSSDAVPLTGSDPASRVLAAWSAASEPASPFHALFRDGNGAPSAEFSATFLSSFAIQNEADEAALDGLIKPVAAPAEIGSLTGKANGEAQSESSVSLNAGGISGDKTSPLNLLAFLTYRPHKEPKDVLPPV